MPRNRYANVCGWEFTTIKCVVMGHFAESCLISTVKARWLVNIENMKKALRPGDVRGVCSKTNVVKYTYIKQIRDGFRCF